MKKIFFFVAALVAGVSLVYFPFLHYVSPGEYGIRFNSVSGDISVDQPGIYITPPWLIVAKVDALPQRVCITSVAKTIYCKLAQFKPEKLSDFVAREGFRYYWWDNRFSFNLGYAEEYRGIRDVMRGYALSGAKQNFIVLSDDTRE